MEEGTMPKKINIDENEIVRLYVEEKWRTKDIAEYFKVSKDLITRRLHKKGVKLRTSCELNRKYNFNEDYFNLINTKEKAYLLGLICADGWVAKGGSRGRPNVLGLAFQVKDQELIEFAIKQIGGNKQARVVKNSVQVTFNSVKLVDRLMEYGIVPNKSLTLNIENVIKQAKIPKELIPSFLLGYFDGDGCITSSRHTQYKHNILWTCTFVGTLETCNFLLNYFNTGFLVDEKSTNKKTYRYQVGGINKVSTVLITLYEQHNGFCLSRKYEKFLTMKSRLKQ